LHGYFNDPGGVKSSGRLLTACLVVVGVLAYPTGFFLPEYGKYASEFSERCFFYAVVFYGSTKGYDIFNAFTWKVRSFLATKKGALAAPAQPTQDKGENTES